MNKKALIFIALCALGLCIGETHAINTTSLAPFNTNKWEIAYPPQGYEEMNPGVYTYSVCSGKQIKTGKLVIVR